MAICYLVETKPQHLEVSNKASGFKQLLKECGSQSLYVMEATGAYYMQLAYFLHEQGCQVAVLNPVIIKRFIQMHLGKGKSDKKDAQWIMRYGQQHELKFWQPEQALLIECRQLEQVIEQLIRQKTMTINSWEALQLQPVKSRLAIKSLLLPLNTLEKQIQQLEDQLQDNLGNLFRKEMKLLRSIPGIGDKTASMLLLFAGGFRDFTNYRQLIAKAGYHLGSTLPDPASAAK